MARDWTDEEKQKIAKHWNAGKSQSQIAALFNVTPSAISGLFNRDRELFPKRGRYKNGVLQEAKPRAKKAVTGNLTGVGDVLDSDNWRCHQPNPNTAHYYYQEETTPRFVFTREKPGTNFRGHGHYSMSLFRINRWVNEQKIEVIQENGEVIVIEPVVSDLAGIKELLAGRGTPLNKKYRHSFVRTSSGHKKMFIYIGNETTPVFNFSYLAGYWRGNGVAAKEAGQIFNWVNGQLAIRKELA